MKKDKSRWKGYESVKYYWITPPGRPVYIIWAKDDKDLRSRFAPWLRLLPAWLLWRLYVRLWRQT